MEIKAGEAHQHQPDIVCEECFLEIGGKRGRKTHWRYRIIDSIMARRQLPGFKNRVERFGTRTEDPEHPETGARDQFQLYQAIYATGEEVGAAGREDAKNWHQAAIEDGVIKP